MYKTTFATTNCAQGIILIIIGGSDRLLQRGKWMRCSDALTSIRSALLQNNVQIILAYPVCERLYYLNVTRSLGKRFHLHFVFSYVQMTEDALTTSGLKRAFVINIKIKGVLYFQNACEKEHSNGQPLVDVLAQDNRTHRRIKGWTP